MAKNGRQGVWTADEMRGYGHINGRRWRCTDPHIPENLRQALVNGLMQARRHLRGKKQLEQEEKVAQARREVHAAKTALGERGPKWWLPMDDKDVLLRMRTAMLVLLSQRGVDKSVCPSEIARIARGDNWRVLMPLVRDEACNLACKQFVRVVQRGKVTSPPYNGPIRIKQGPRFDDWWNLYQAAP